MDYSTWFVLLEIVISIFAGLYFYIKQKYSYWSNRGVAGPPPSLLHFGNVLQLEGAPQDQIELEMLRKYGKVYGIYTGLQPTLVVLDEALIKTVLVKDFSAFTDRRALNTYHELVNCAQFFTEGDHWAKVRSITRMAFTSGRLKAMTPLFDRCVGQLLDHLDSIVSKKGANGDVPATFEPLPVLFTFSIDAISATAFATEVNSYQGIASEGKSPLLKHALNFFTISPLKALSYFALPRLINDLFGVQHIFNAASFDYATALIREILRQRRQTKVKVDSNKHKDLIQLLMDAYVDESELKKVESGNFDRLETRLEDEKDDDVQAKLEQSPSSSSSSTTTTKANKLTLNENEIVAQAILFFVAAFETVSSALTFALYELTVNGDIQDRLYNELVTVFEGSRGRRSSMASSSSSLSSSADNVLYEKLMSSGDLPYLDAVCKEALRKYPPGKRLERRVTVEQYKLGDILLKRGQLVEIPLIAVMRNPEYFPQPEVFNPERFLPTEEDIAPQLGPFLAFGQGPKNCIGARFAYLEMKMALSKMLLKFRFSPTADTPARLVLETFKPSLMPKPFLVAIERR